MKTTFLTEKRQINIARISMVVVMLALIRCIGECLRIGSPAGFETLYPFLLGAFTCAISVFAMLLLLFFNKPKPIVTISILTIIILIYIKSIYL